MQNIHPFRICPIEISRVILGSDPFVFWIHQGGDSPFRNSDDHLDVSKVLEVMKVGVEQGVMTLDLPRELIEAYQRLRKETGKDVVGLGALQEWTCKNVTIDGVPLEEFSEELKATINPKLPSRFLKSLGRFDLPGAGFIKSFFVQKRPARPLQSSQIDGIELNRRHFENQLALYEELNVKLVQFGGGLADWLVGVGRTDLLQELAHMITSRGCIPILICHWTSMVLPVCEEELDVEGYIVPLNKQWGLLTLPEALKAIKDVEKPVIAMKPLALGALAYDIRSAFTFLFEKAKVAAIMVGVSSKVEAEQTFTIAEELLKEGNKRPAINNSP